MIPKIIHYCWFGRKPLPPLALHCIESWKKFFPDYEIKEWNENNFDVNILPYTTEAYEAKKYAFVSDYARFWILYNYGGLYFDTDVEVIKSFEDIVSMGAFMGCETSVHSETSSLAVAPGLGLGCESGLSFYKEMLDLYASLNFIKEDQSLNLKTIVEYTTELLIKFGLKHINEIQLVSDIYIYPKEYFCPIDYRTKKCNITHNTRTIHHYAESWHNKRQKLKGFIIRILGDKIVRHLVSIKNILKNYS